VLVKLFAPMQPYDLADDIAPNPTEIGRVDLRAQAQPAIEAVQSDQLPTQIQAGRGQNPHPNGPYKQAQTETQHENAREPREREGPHRCHCLVAPALPMRLGWR